MTRQYDVQAQLLQPEELRQARIALGLSYRGMAEILLLSPGNGNELVKDWEEGRRPITGPASQCVRLWLAAKGLGEIPPMPVDRARFGGK